MALFGADGFLQAISASFKQHSPKRTRCEFGSAVVDNPFDNAQSEWLARSLSATLETFGSHVDKRFQRNEVEILASRERIVKLEAEVSSLLEKLTNGDISSQSGELQAQHVQLESRITEMDKKLALSLLTPSEGGQSSSSTGPADLPYEHRLCFVMGNLGWDATEEVIEKRAKEVLGLCNLVQEQYVGPVAVRKKGSLAEVTFYDAAVGTLTRLRTKLLRKSYANHSQTGEPRFV